MKIKSHPGVSNINMCDYTKPELRHQPDAIILHCGINDMSNDINTLKKLKSILKEIEKYDTQKNPLSCPI